MLLDKYQTRATRTDVFRGKDSPAFVLLGLFGESGSVLSEVKKKQRDRLDPPLYKERVIEEFGDLLWYIAITASRNEISLGQVASKAQKLRKRRRTKRPSRMTFSDVQRDENLIIHEPSMFLEWRLIDLAIAAAEVLRAHRSFLTNKRASRLRTH